MDKDKITREQHGNPYTLNIPANYNEIYQSPTTYNNTVNENSVNKNLPQLSDNFVSPDMPKKHRTNPEELRDSMHTILALSSQTADETSKSKKTIKDKIKKAINPILSIGRSFSKIDKKSDSFTFLGIAIAAPAYMMQNRIGHRPVI